jgi:hypothetical protein
MTTIPVNAIPLFARSELQDSQLMGEENAQLREENRRLWYQHNRSMIEKQRLENECARLRQLLSTVSGARQEHPCLGPIETSIQEKLEARGKSAFTLLTATPPQAPSIAAHSKCASCQLRRVTRRRYCGHYCCLGCVSTKCIQCVD